jgi:hypothetical protein
MILRWSQASQKLLLSPHQGDTELGSGRDRIQIGFEIKGLSDVLVFDDTEELRENRTGSESGNPRFKTFVVEGDYGYEIACHLGAVTVCGTRHPICEAVLIGVGLRIAYVAESGLFSRGHCRRACTRGCHANPRSRRPSASPRTEPRSTPYRSRCPQELPAFSRN